MKTRLASRCHFSHDSSQQNKPQRPLCFVIGQVTHETLSRQDARFDDSEARYFRFQNASLCWHLRLVLSFLHCFCSNEPIWNKSKSISNELRIKTFVCYCFYRVPLKGSMTSTIKHPSPQSLSTTIMNRIFFILLAKTSAIKAPLFQNSHENLSLIQLFNKWNKQVIDILILNVVWVYKKSKKGDSF